jgi:hypothetical protein
MLVSNNDMWDVKITLQCVTFDHGSKNLVKSTNLRLVKKTIPVILNLLKLTYLKKLKGFFYYCHFGVFFGLKTWFEKLEILVVLIALNESKSFQKDIL